MAIGEFSCTMNGQAWSSDSFPANCEPDGIDKLRAICPGDFQEFYEFWSVKREGLPAAIPLRHDHCVQVQHFDSCRCENGSRPTIERTAFTSHCATTTAFYTREPTFIHLVHACEVASSECCESD
ncbi:hypothetical protein M3Y94_00118600 [Aphelenchoides besseyi]|nr:hypothetical protein M3Y94_00118600 [Aphelenchoides besseyi]